MVRPGYWSLGRKSWLKNYTNVSFQVGVLTDIQRGVMNSPLSFFRHSKALRCMWVQVALSVVTPFSLAWMRKVWGSPCVLLPLIVPQSHGLWKRHQQSGKSRGLMSHTGSTMVSAFVSVPWVPPRGDKMTPPCSSALWERILDTGEAIQSFMMGRRPL